MKQKKEIEVIDRGGAKTVAKKTSIITWARRIFILVSVIWLIFVAWFPLHIKNTYSGPIKKSIVVTDTDSAIICLDGWYRYMLDKINGEVLRSHFVINSKSLAYEYKLYVNFILSTKFNRKRPQVGLGLKICRRAAKPKDYRHSYAARWVA